MAARLVRRCCRWHLGTFLSPPPASLPPPSGQTSPGTARPRAPGLFLHLPDPRSFSIREQVEEGGGGAEKLVGELIETASSPQELLQLSQHHSLTSNQASMAISQLARLAAEKKWEAESILRDEGFQQLLSITDSQISQVWNNTLVSLLKSLYWLGLGRGCRELQSVEQEVLWRLRRLSFRQLCSLAEFLALRQGQENKLLQEVIKKLELRWTELEGTRSVVTLVSRVGHSSPALMERLEDKALELAEQFDPEEIRKLSLALAFQNRRSVPLLRAFSYHLLQKNSQLSPSILMDLIFAYGKLNFQQPQLLQRISSELVPHVPSLSALELSRCLRSFALLKWLSLPLCEAVAQYTLDNTKQLSVSQLCGIILSFARLNFQPSASEDFFTMVHEELQNQLENLEPQQVTELVWSLCVLQQARAPYLQRVLTPQFLAQIQDQSLRAHNLRLKLLHINAAARLETPEYRGPFLPPEVLSTPEVGGERVTPLQSTLREALLGLLGSRDNGRFDVHTLYGWHMDAEVVMSSEHKPLPIQDFAAPHLLHAKGTKPLPPGARRVAFLRWEFPNFSNRGKELLGRYAMARRHLQAAGFLLVDVPHYEFLELKLERQRSAYLKDKLNKALAQEMAS